MSGERWDPRNFDEDRNQFREQTVYFDFDKSTIKASEQSKIQSVANYLKSEPRAMLNVEGHCDERGTAEYNRSLGERRALAVREYLISLGTIGERINTISFGEDKPADPGHDEAAWAKNRRGEFILLRPKR
jgi:peptidoglycan-associated lipoprotein